jgi:hypothetical protein
MSKSTLTILIVVFAAFLVVIGGKMFITSYFGKETTLSQWSKVKDKPSCEQQIANVRAMQSTASPSGSILVVNATGQTVSTVYIKDEQVVQETTDAELKPKLEKLFNELQASTSAYQMGIVCSENNKQIVKQYMLKTDPSKSDYMNYLIYRLDLLLTKTQYGIKWCGEK